jgi:hypothetical protein
MNTHVRVAAAAVALSGLMSAVLVAGPADAKPKHHKPKHHQPKAAKPFSLTWNAAATTTATKLGQQIDFPATTFTATIRPKKRTLSGPLVLPPATTAIKLGQLDLVKITMQVAEPSQVTGKIKVDGPVWTIDAQQSYRVLITKVTGPAGLVNLVKPGCGTARTTATLSGTVDFAKVGAPGGPGDYTMSGSYPIPEFTGCGLLMDGLLSSLVAGPGNPLSVHFTS